MADLYEPPQPDSALRQGEVLEGVEEIRFDISSGIEPGNAPNISVEVISHPWCIVLTPDCDLDWDFKARRGQAQEATKLVTHVLLCDLEDSGRLKEARVKQAKLLSLVKENRDERYHYLPLGTTGSGTGLPEFFIDFKRVFSLPTDYLYAVLQRQSIKRHGYLRTPWVQHLADRFTYFLGRVALPDNT